MKRIFYILATFFWIGCFSQTITVDTNTYTIPQLVTDVLVNKVCVPVSNISWRTGNTNAFGSTNGIGYFENKNPSFPLQSGVILSTGNVLNSIGPNTSILNDGNDAWTGDADLEATLLAAGITMTSVNASVLEFDFIPFSANFNFQFLFASEEYGNFQCQFSDAFAFLLTNKTTGITTNLAVVPGTTTPISVVTIRDFLYNSSCSSVNSNYFGTFNGGSLAANSATNFNGQTIVMNATSTTLVPNTAYHIKLVIADRQDYQADSAIFLGANSFNVGQDVLGQDLTIANKTAVCDGESQTLVSGLSSAIYTFAWTYNGNPIGGNTPNFTVNNPGFYGLTYTITSTGCVVTTDYLAVEYYTPRAIPEPIDLYKCDQGQSNLIFDLSVNTPIVNVTGTQISYHSTLAEANLNINPLPNSYTIASANLPSNIWIRILDTSTNCVKTKSFQLGKTPPPVANNPGDFLLCESPPDSGTADFNIALQTPKVLGSQSPAIYEVSYHTNPTDANAGTNPINTAVNYVTSNIAIIARIQNKTDPSCFSTVGFNLIVIPRPKLDQIQDQFVCTNYTLPVFNNQAEYYSGPNKTLPKLFPGDVIDADRIIYIYFETSTTPSCLVERSFFVKIVKPVNIYINPISACDQYLLPIPNYGTRYFTQPGGSSGGGTELFANISNINSQGVNKIYTYFESTDSSHCIIEGVFEITISPTPKINGAFPNVFECVSYNLPSLIVGKYYTFDEPSNAYIPAISPIKSTTKLYVFAISNGCRTPDIVFTVYINKIGLPNINQCPAYDLPPAPLGEYRDSPNGGGNIIQPGLIYKSTTIYTYVPGAGTPNCTNTESFTVTINAPYLTLPPKTTICESFVLPPQVDGGDYYTLPGGPTTSGNVRLTPNVSELTSTTTIYIYKVSTTVANCFNEISWLITINLLPKIDSRADIIQCDSYVLTPLINGNYYDDPKGVNLLGAGTAISSNNRIYIYAVNPNDPGCFSENFFDITIKGVKADPIPSILNYCGSFTFPRLPTPNNFYYDAPGGPNGSGNKIPVGTIISAATIKPVYYIYYENGDRFNCYDEKQFSITIVNKPIAYPVNKIGTCDIFDKNDGVFEFDLTTLAIRNQIINGQSPDSDYTMTFYYTWLEANNVNAISIANPSTYLNKIPFNDSVWIRVSNNQITSSCFDTVELKLIINPLPYIQLLPEYFICKDYKTGTLLNPTTLNTGITASNFIFEWTLDSIPFGGNTASITTSKIGDYKVKVTNTNTNCINTGSAKVIKYAPYVELEYSDAFENTTYITISVLGSGSSNYEYQIDDSLFQDSNIFTNVAPGEHRMSVRDKDGHCNPAPISAVIINYPKFFTPNGDGYNDTWNIPHLILTNPNSPIHIFDKFGKFIKEISPSSNGWNGFYNGKPLPASDYWFTVDYSEKGITKTFKSHFTLKR
jgi:gliding motility-associated-like protein